MTEKENGNGIEFPMNASKRHMANIQKELSITFIMNWSWVINRFYFSIDITKKCLIKKIKNSYFNINA